MKKLAVTILSLALLCSMKQAFAASYYVASAGSDSNPGTQAQPWQTIAKVNATTLSAGDTVYFNGGDTFSDGTLKITNSGTSSNPITITSYGTGRAIIDASASTTHYDTIYINNASYVTVTNLKIVGNIVPNTSAVGYKRAVNIEVTNNQVYRNVSITNNEIVYGIDGVAILATTTGGNTARYNNVSVTDNVIHDSVFHAVASREEGSAELARNFDNIYIARNEAYNIQGIANTTEGGGFVLFVSDCTNSIIEYNYVHDSGQTTLKVAGGPAGIFPYYCDNTIVRNNIVTRIYRPAGIDGSGIDNDFGNTGGIFEYNYVYETQGDCYLNLSSGATFRFNVCVHGGLDSGSISGFRNQAQTTFHNNTLICIATCISDTADAGSKYYNNIIYATSSQLFSISGTTNTLQGNLYYTTQGTHFNGSYNGTTYTSLATFQASTTNEASGRGYNVDPNLFDQTSINRQTDYNTFNTALVQYRPNYGSTALKHGLNLLTTFSKNPGTIDFNLLSLTVPYSIGAYDRGYGTSTVNITGKVNLNGTAFILNQ